MQKRIPVWVGFTDDMEHCWRDEWSGSRYVAVFYTRAEAEHDFEDARKGVLTINMPKPRKRSR